jgi:hypothetical protein
VDKFKAWWDSVQALLDIDGDVWMGLFTGFILFRLIGVPLWHWPPLTGSEAGTYASAVGAFAYSNRGPKS